MQTSVKIATKFNLKVHFFREACPQTKSGFRGGARGAEAPPSRFIAPLSKVLLAERGTGKSRSSVSLDSLHVMATVKEGRMEGRVVAKRLGDGP